MTEAMKLETTDEALRNALAWYGEQARLARLIHSEGDPGRWALAEDGGKRAREVLALSASPAGVVKPLEWTDAPYTSTAETPHIRYVVTERDDDTGPHWYMTVQHLGSVYARRDTMVEIKAAAFADYSARIMSAIEPAGVGVEMMQDKIDGLEADLDNAVEVAFKRGATEWCRLNYPKHYDRLARAALKGDEQ